MTTSATKTIISNYGLLKSYVVNNKSIEKIHFFKDGKIFYTSNSSWLEGNKEPEGKYFSDIGRIEVNEVKKANKLNLNRKENFTFKDELYLFIDDENIKIYETQRILSYESEREYNFSDIIRIELTCGFKHGEDTELKKRALYMPIGFYIVELKEFGKTCKAISDDMKAINIDLSVFEIEKILKYYDMTKKSGVEIEK